jgi:catechol 2,3-dioxygenase-like lactoylglutathione lyase family enzyme
MRTESTEVASMKRLVMILGLALGARTPLSAQVSAPNDAGVAMGQLGTIVRDVDATKKFWAFLGGTPIKVDGVEVIKFPGVLVFLRKGEPTGGSQGTAVDHPGFHVPSGQETLEKFKTAGVRVEFNPRAVGLGYVYSPDDLRVEILGNEVLRDDKITVPAVSDHLHIFLPEASVAEIQAWYEKEFGAVPTLGPGKSAAGDLPGIRLFFGKAAAPPAPTKGRALDYIGLEVKNLEPFCKKLDASGAKFDQPYSKLRHKGYASAELTDPWGTSIELTEGLNRF